MERKKKRAEMLRSSHDCKDILWLNQTIQYVLFQSAHIPEMYTHKMIYIMYAAGTIQVSKGRSVCELPKVFSVYFP